MAIIKVDYGEVGSKGTVVSELVAAQASKSAVINNGYYSITDGSSSNLSNGTIVNGVLTKIYQNGTYCNASYNSSTNTLSFTNNYNQVRFSYAAF